MKPCGLAAAGIAVLCVICYVVFVWANKSSNIEIAPVNSNAIGNKTETSIQSHCAARHSIVELKNNKDSAGLEDRLSVIQFFGFLANSQCAQLVFPKPCYALAWNHNRHGVPISRHLDWSFFYDIRFKDGTPLFASEDTRVRDASSSGDVVWIDESNGDGIQQLRAVMAATAENKTFHWRIAAAAFPLMIQLQSHPSVLATIVQNKDFSVTINDSPFVQSVVDITKQKMNISADNFYSVHLRRQARICGDTENSHCDNSPEFVQRYLRCSLQGCDHLPRTLIFTDIEDTGYVDKISKILPAPGGAAISADDVIRRAIQKLIDTESTPWHAPPILTGRAPRRLANTSAPVLLKHGIKYVYSDLQSNYFVYAVGRSLHREARTHFVRRCSTHCTPCDPACPFAAAALKNATELVR